MLLLIECRPGNISWKVNERYHDTAIVRKIVVGAGFEKANTIIAYPKRGRISTRFLSLKLLARVVVIVDDALCLGLVVVVETKDRVM